jgi:crotonobetainyl-CoA:carnitine CoA-transferase CaiB-like acyl-CoA transferase
MQNGLSQPLKGIRVLDFTRLYPGPLCTLMLADLGADVIKIEAPEGELGRWMASAFAQLNRNKRSLTLDLQKEQSGKIVRKILERTDVLVESFRPGVMKRFDLDYETLRALFPRLIYCSITGYGQSGPDAHRPGHDLNYISQAGILSTDGKQDPAIPTVQIADTIGGFQAITAILAGLLQREKTAAGTHLDISLLDGAFFAMMIPASGHLTENNDTTEDYLSGKLACYNVYRTLDRKYLALALLEPKFWRRFCMKIGLSHLVESQFQENQDELIQILSSRMAERNLQDWMNEFQSEDVCITPVQNFRDSLLSDKSVDRHLYRRAEYSFGSLLHMRTPFASADSAGRAPELSEHTESILQEAGYSREEIQEFIRHKIV